MRYHLKCLFLLTADTTYVQLPHSLVVLDKTPQRTSETRTKTDGATRTQAGTWSKSPSFPQEVASAWTGSDQGNRSLGKAGETPTASMLRQSLSILKQFGSGTR